jgi:pimeloyl-ACP methyl ester carboxylesterase
MGAMLPFEPEPVRWIESDGLRLCSLSIGPARHPGIPAPTPATPVLMLHGWVTGNMATWYPGYAIALARERRVVLFDQRGHGESLLGEITRTVAFDLDHLSDDVGSVLRGHELSDAPVDIVAYSMGAVVALRYALRFPEAVRRLVLLDAPAPPSRYVAPSLAGVRCPDDLNRFFGTHHVMPTGRRLLRLQQRATHLLFGTTLVRDVETMGEESDEALARLKAPSLLIYGTHSPFAEAGRRLSARMPAAHIEWLDSDHDLVFSHAGLLLPMIRKFLDTP